MSDRMEIRLKRDEFQRRKCTKRKYLCIVEIYSQYCLYWLLSDYSHSRIPLARQDSGDISLSSSVWQKVPPVPPEAAVVHVVLGGDDKRKPAMRPAPGAGSTPLNGCQVLTDEYQLLNHNQRHHRHGNVHVARAHKWYRRSGQKTRHDEFTTGQLTTVDCFCHLRTDLDQTHGSSIIM